MSTLTGTRCTHWVGPEARECGSTDSVRPFLQGPRCPIHDPNVFTVPANDCITCDLPETRWDPTDPLYVCGGPQCPDCRRHDLNEQATRKHAEK